MKINKHIAARALGTLLCLLCAAAAGYGQEQVRTIKVGQNGSDVRILIAFISVAEDSYRMQSMIIDVDPGKKGQEPNMVTVDLTSTDRFLSTGEKKQKILVLRWKKAAEIELKCDGKWVKQETQPAALEKIIQTIKEVIQSVPMDAKDPIDVTLPKAVEDKVSALLNTFYTEVTCIKSGK